MTTTICLMVRWRQRRCPPSPARVRACRHVRDGHRRPGGRQRRDDGTTRCRGRRHQEGRGCAAPGSTTTSPTAQPPRQRSGSACPAVSARQRPLISLLVRCCPKRSRRQPHPVAPWWYRANGGGVGEIGNESVAIGVTNPGLVRPRGDRSSAHRRRRRRPRERRGVANHRRRQRSALPAAPLRWGRQCLRGIHAHAQALAATTLT